jgi:hypothetical protein
MAIPEEKLIEPQNVKDNRDAQPSPEDAPESTPGARRISDKKLAANRASAQKSTGPSEAGKKITRLNALTHGLLARDTVIRLGDYQEEFIEYLELLDDLWERYRPVGHAEELEVEIMAKCDWMEVRETRVTNAIIRRRTLGMREREERRRAEAFADVRANCPVRALLEETAPGLQYIIDMMEDVKAQMQDEKLLEGKELPEELQESLGWLVKNYPEEFTPGCETKTLTLYGGPTVVVEPAYVQQVVAAIDQQLARLVPLQTKTAWLEEEQLKAKIDAAALPVRYLERTGRYMTAKDRRRERSKRRLDDLQKARKASGRMWPVKGA